MRAYDEQRGKRALALVANQRHNAKPVRVNAKIRDAGDILPVCKHAFPFYPAGCRRQSHVSGSRRVFSSIRKFRQSDGVIAIECGSSSAVVDMNRTTCQAFLEIDVFDGCGKKAVP